MQAAASAAIIVGAYLSKCCTMSYAGPHAPTGSEASVNGKHQTLDQGYMLEERWCELADLQQQQAAVAAPAAAASGHASIQLVTTPGELPPLT